MCWLLAMVVLTGLLSGCGDSSVKTEALVEDTGNDDDWTVASEGAVLLENDRLRLELDATTTHFTVTDLIEGHVYHSVPQDSLPAISTEVKSRLTSEVTVVYYDADSTRQAMFSSTNSVELGQSVVKTDNKAIRVYYTIGQMASNMLVPVAFDRSVFENRILGSNQLLSGQIRRLKRNYELYAADEQPDDYADKLAQYPALSERDLYILKDTVDTLDRIEINDLLTLVGYTQEEYKAFLDEIGVQEQAAEEPGFVIPLEYTLEADGFSARVLTDKITENSQQFKLVSVDVLEYFASCGIATQGEFLVPDGVGASIRFNNAKSGAYYQEFYGKDKAQSSSATYWKGQTASLPVWGMTFDDGGGIFGIVESGAEVAALNAKVYSAANPQNNAFVSFTLRAMDTTDIGTDRNIPIYNLYSKHLVQTTVKLRYVLFSGKPDAADYAVWYRRYLQEQGKLAPIKAQGAAPLMLDYLGMTYASTTVMGIPYDKPVGLSTLDSIQEDVQMLKEKGAARLELRLFGSEGSGVEYTAHKNYSLNKKVGDIASLLQLAKELAASDGRLYLDADPTRVYRDTLFDGYNLKQSTARLMNRSLVRIEENDFVGSGAVTGGSSYFLVSPTMYESLLNGFSRDVAALGEGASLIGLSCGDMGRYLAGDYHSDRDLDRVMSRLTADEVLTSLTGKGISLTADGANAYMLSYVDLLYNVPLTTTAFDIQHRVIPFLPMVLHGYVEYAGMPLNLAEDSEMAWLQTLAYGAAPYYCLITEDNSVLSEAGLDKWYYNLSSNGMLETVATRYAEAADYLNAVQCATITKYTYLESNVTVTAYNNGVSIVVNYSDEPYTYNGTQISPKGYLVRGLVKGGD